MIEKQQSASISGPYVVTRSIVVPNLNSTRCEQRLREKFNELKGTGQLEVDLEHKRLHITYDAAQIGYEKVEKVLIEAEYPPSENWWSRIKAAIYKYKDENDRATAASGDASCCSSPTDIYAQRRRPKS